MTRDQIRDLWLKWYGEEFPSSYQHEFWPMKEPTGRDEQTACYFGVRWQSRARSSLMSRMEVYPEKSAIVFMCLPVEGSTAERAREFFDEAKRVLFHKIDAHRKVAA